MIGDIGTYDEKNLEFLNGGLGFVLQQNSFFKTNINFDYTLYEKQQQKKFTILQSYFPTKDISLGMGYSKIDKFVKDDENIKLFINLYF